jgi:hypothetical protein
MDARSRLIGTRLIGTRLVGTRLIGTCLIGTRLIGTCLIGTCLIGTWLIGVCRNGLNCLRERRSHHARSLTAADVPGKPRGRAGLIHLSVSILGDLSSPIAI